MRYVRHELVGCGLAETVDYPVHGLRDLIGGMSGDVLGDSIGVEPAAGLPRPSCVTLRGMKQFIGKRHGCFQP